MTRKKYLGKQKGFTLIELLIVVGIIALLVSILMPALRAAKERSKRILCTSQLHQMGVVFIQYAQDFDDYFPSFYYNNTGFMLWNTPDKYLTWLGDGFGSEMFAQLAPGHYGLPHKVFYCPGMQPDKYHGTMVDDWWWYKPNNDGGPTHQPNRDLQSNTDKACTPGGPYDAVNWGYALYVIRRESCSETGKPHPFDANYGNWHLTAGRDYTAPSRASSRTAPFNPVVSDLVLCWWGASAYYGAGLSSTHASLFTLPYGGDRIALTGLVGREKIPSLIDQSTHKSNTGLITQSNSLYAEGRVVENPGETVVPYYAGSCATFW